MNGTWPQPTRGDISAEKSGYPAEKSGYPAENTEIRGEIRGGGVIFAEKAEPEDIRSEPERIRSGTGVRSPGETVWKNLRKSVKKITGVK